MYVPEQFKIADLSATLAVMRGSPFAALVSHDAAGLMATHLPTVVSAEGDKVTIECHLARGNPHWRRLQSVPEAEIMMIFNGPDAYIRPGWYPSKAENGKSVPTWNYAIVHAYGRAQIVEDGAWLLRHVEALSRQQESPYATPWSTADAPEDYIAAMVRGIVGLRVDVTRLDAKAKLGQNRDERDALGAVAGLQARGQGDDAIIAAMMRAARGRA